MKHIKPLKKTLRVLQRLPFLLLEVMIAFLLMALCLVPLLQPHYAMLQSDLMILEESKIERVVHKIYAEFLVSLYRGEVTWSAIDHYDTPARTQPVNPQLLEGLPYNVTYVLRVAPYKGKRKGEYSKGGPPKASRNQHPYHLLEIIYTFSPQDEGSRETREFSFRLYAKKDVSNNP